MATYKTRHKQSVFDLAIQLYGDVSEVGKIMTTFTDLDNNIPVGSSLEVEATKDPIALYFGTNKIIVATDL
jgi:hypothetical protein